MSSLGHGEDTIAAIATSAGSGGIGIVRLSGSNALAIADQMFLTKNKKKPSAFKNYTAHYGWMVKRKQKLLDLPPQLISGLYDSSERDGDEYEIIDEALLTVMRAPRSYTREDVVEMSCHGGMVSLKATLICALDLGARLAEAGEFTKRAFLNGRIDLAQAEAVLDIIQSRTEAFLKVSTHQLKGELSVELEAIREILMRAYVQIEAVINFPDDDMEDQRMEGLCEPIQSSRQRIDDLLASSEHGRILKEGIKIVICGRSNVGKSSLLNILLKIPRAIVSPVAGTTRDTIEEMAQIRGVPFQLVDTAGLLDPRDHIEEEAIRRSRMHIKGADLLLFVLDASEALTREDEGLLDDLKDQEGLIILNKCDLPMKIDEGRIISAAGRKKILKISVIQKTGIEGLETAIVEHVWHGKTVDPHGILVSNLRHIHALKDCRGVLKRAQEILADGLSLEFVSEEIKRAVNSLDSITGRHISADLLDQIFSRFCVGK
ncbi:MAG: hypothetical protein A2Z81_05970 [Omnitrophica WOR_2 bacterium GWA2_45_18]|nr:MAG: hypothetical protein A2Z81_05970 [Omnitrophica WOR_2 bacterium GWA2_45_18]